MCFDDAKELAVKHNLTMKEAYPDGEPVYFMVINGQVIFYHKNDDQTMEPIEEEIRDYIEDFDFALWRPATKIR